MVEPTKGARGKGVQIYCGKEDGATKKSKSPSVVESRNSHPSKTTKGGAAKQRAVRVITRRDE